VNTVIYSPRELGGGEQLPISVAASSGTKVWRKPPLTPTSHTRAVWGASYQWAATLCIGVLWRFRHNQDAKRHQPKCYHQL